MSYNAALNLSANDRAGLVASLESSTNLPPYSPVATLSHQQGDASLLDMLTRRDFSDISKVMSMQYEKFGGINADLFWSAMQYIVTKDGVSRELVEIAKGAKVQYLDIPIPDNKLFRRMKGLHNEYFNELIAYSKTVVEPGVHDYTCEQLCNIFSSVLKHEGLDALGWGVAVNEKTNFISIAKRQKRILVSPRTVRYGQGRLIGLIIHEIGVHVRWSENYTSQSLKKAEEGIGTFVEQLTIGDFQLLRLYRFLAICFAAGIDGVARDMRQTHELVLQVRRALKPQETAAASRHFAAKEVVRVFRNLPFDMPGLVYIRDKQYFEHK